jgi:hypothetical protein
MRRFVPIATCCTAVRTALFDHLVGTREQRRQDFSAERFFSPSETANLRSGAICNSSSGTLKTRKGARELGNALSLRPYLWDY